MTPREVNEQAQQWIEGKVAEIVAQSPAIGRTEQLPSQAPDGQPPPVPDVVHWNSKFTPEVLDASRCRSSHSRILAALRRRRRIEFGRRHLPAPASSDRRIGAHDLRRLPGHRPWRHMELPRNPVCRRADGRAPLAVARVADLSGRDGRRKCLRTRLPTSRSRDGRAGRRRRLPRAQCLHAEG